MTERAQDLFSKITSTAELSIDLAYSAIIFNNRDLAEDVVEMHSKLERMYLEFGPLILLLAKKVDRPQNLFVILRTSRSFREMSDSATSLADVVLRGLPSHELLQSMFEESDETFVKVTVEYESPLAGKPLLVTRPQDETGMRIIAIKRGEAWIHGPDRNSVIEGGDVLFARGPIEGEDSLRKLASGTQFAEAT